MGDRRNNSLSLPRTDIMTLPPTPAQVGGNGPPAVEVRSAYKSFSNGVPVLNNYDMTVPNGTM